MRVWRYPNECTEASPLLVGAIARWQAWWAYAASCKLMEREV